MIHLHVTFSVYHSYTYWPFLLKSELRPTTSCDIALDERIREELI